MFKVSNRNTRTNCEICSSFIRTSLEHNRISRLLLGVRFGNLNMYFQTGPTFDVKWNEFICKSNIYKFHTFFFMVLQRFSSYKYMLHHSNTQQTLACSNPIIDMLDKVWNVFSISHKDNRTTSSRRSGVFIVNFEHI